MSTEIERDLIFDLGVNHGEDSDFYLSKGFRVVGVEADPTLVEELRIVFANPIAEKRFTLEPVGIMDEPGTKPFYRNITCDHWSSFDPSYGCRNDTEYETINVNCVVLEDLVKKYGCPYYLKIDVEGADRLILKQLKALPARPTFLSVEEFGTGTIEALYALGYNMFSLRPQQDKSWAILPDPAREGRFAPREFTQRDSGPFGLEVPEWMPLESAKKAFHEKVRGLNGEWLPPPGEWYDLHATNWPRTIDDKTLDLIA